jgi:hypothetical protein
MSEMDSNLADRITGKSLGWKASETSHRLQIEMIVAGLIEL